MSGKERKQTVPTSRTLFATALLCVLLAGTQTAYGAATCPSGPGPGDGQGMQVNGVCMDDLFPGSLNCNAKDVRIANVTLVRVEDDGCKFLGDDVTFTANYEVLLGSVGSGRHDIGIFFSSDGDPNFDGALTGLCSINTLPYKPNPSPFTDLDNGRFDSKGDPITDPWPGENKGSGCTDWCGDIDDSPNPIVTTITLTAKCIDSNGDGKLEVPWCTSWREPGSNFLCIKPEDAFPGAPSKCMCGPALTIPIDVPPYDLAVDKSVVPTEVPEPGGTVTYTVSVTNPSPYATVTLNSLTDSIYVDITTTGHDGITATTCATGGTLAKNDQDTVPPEPDVYTCTFTVSVSGNPQTIIDTVDVYGTDSFGHTVTGSDWAQVKITPVAATISIVKAAVPSIVAEPGADVTYGFTVTNLSSFETVTVTSLVDSIYGDLNGQGDCAVPFVLAPDDGKPSGPDTYSCSVTKFVGGNYKDTVTNIVTASGVDDDNDPVGPVNASATVTIGDVPGAISVVKTAVPESMNEPGGAVTFTVTVTNTSLVDAVTIDSLKDSVYGNLLDLTDEGGTAKTQLSTSCALPQPLNVGASYSCSFTANVTGEAGFAETDIVTASGVDADGVPVSASDPATVTIVDVAPDITIVKTASPSTVPETGGSVTFTFSVTNNSTAESFTLNSLIDDKFGDLNGQGTCSVPQAIEAGGTYTCSVVKYLVGDDLAAHKNIATAKGQDNEGNPDEDTDDETVTFEDVKPSVSLSKVANPTYMMEPGGIVTYTLTITNTSGEAATITALSDTNNLSAECLALVGTPLAPGGSASCTYTMTYVEAAIYPNTANVTLSDNDENSASAEAKANVTVDNAPPAVDLVKTVDPLTLAEPGGDFTYTLTIKNLSAEQVKITALSDTNNLSAECLALVNTFLPAGGTASCTYTVTRTEAGVYANTASVTVKDNEGSEATDTDNKEVTVTDALPTVTLTKAATPTSLPEPGGLFTFELTITNTSAENVTISALTDTNALSPECQALVGTVLAPSGSAKCSYQVNHGEAGVYPNTANVTVKDNENNEASAKAEASVSVTDVKPEIGIDKSANPTVLPETGGTVTFTFVITNKSTAENVTITSLTDSKFGNIGAQGTCVGAIGKVLTPLETFTCTVDKILASDTLEAHTNVVTAKGEDNDGNTAEASDDATVTFENVPPQVALDKSATPLELPEPGGDFTYTLTITNKSAETVTITALTDDNPLSPECLALIGTTMAAGENKSCTYVVHRTEFGTYPNTAKVTVEDNDKSEATAQDTAEVKVTNTPPVVDLLKSVDPASRPEPGGVFTYTLTVKNTSVETVTIVSLTDTNELSAECKALIGQAILAGGEKSCTYTATYTEAGKYPNTANVTVEDNDKSTASDTATAQATVTDVTPTVALTKAADPATLPEPGGVFTYTLTVKNNSPESVTISSLTDTNALSAECTVLIGQGLAVGESKFCTYTVTRTEAGIYPNTAEVKVKDNENNEASATANASVTVTNVAPTITVAKTNDANGDGIYSDTEQAPYEGAAVPFKVTITNTGVEAVKILSIADDKFPVGTNCTALVGTFIPADGSVSCVFNGTAPKDAANPGASAGPLSQTDTASATVSDNEGGTSTASDTSVVTTPPRGKAVVAKSVTDGSSPAGYMFEIRRGASTTSVGTVLVSGQTDAAGSLTFQWLLPSMAAGDYQLCEANVPPGWTSSLRNEPGAFNPPDAVGAFFVPNAIDPMVNNSFYCVPFTLDAAETQTFTVANSPPPGGDGRTIGYWKNWNSCSGGGQKPVLDETLALSLLMVGGNHGVWIGNLFVDTCSEGVSILNKSTLSNQKKASDAAYELASQLLAARLNVIAGARNCDALTTIINNAQLLLVQIYFTGTGSYLDSKVKGSLLTKRNQALALAKQLDDYNNNRGACMPPAR